MAETNRESQQTTADVILEAAAKLFSEKGYDGARVDELARRAAVNKATLYYQVGDKEAIYHAVIDRLLGRMVEEMERRMGEFDDCEEQIDQYIKTIARSTGSFRYMAPIMLREIASGGENLPTSALDHMGRLLSLLDGAISAGITEGRFQQVDSFMIHMLVIGSLNLYAVNEPVRHKMAQHNGSDHPSNHFYSTTVIAEQISDLILAALRNR